MKTFKQFSEQAYTSKQQIDEGLLNVIGNVAKKVIKPVATQVNKEVVRPAVRSSIRWISRGKNKRVPNEKTASWGRLAKDDLQQLGKFRKPSARTKKPQDLTSDDFEGTFLPNPMKPHQVKDFLTGKGGITWSFGQGRETGPTPIQRQALYRSYRGIRDAARKVKGTLSGN